jgi:hypothetical protein
MRPSTQIIQLRLEGRSGSQLAILVKYTKTWVWNGIELKKNLTSKNSVTTLEIMKVEKDPPLTEDLFTLPASYTAISQNEVMERLKKSMEELKQKSNPKEVKVELRSGNNRKGIAGFIYIDTDDSIDAEQTIKIMDSRNWFLLATAGQPGVYNRELAKGEISKDGILVGLPGDTFVLAKKVWKVGHIEATVGKEKVAGR